MKRVVLLFVFCIMFCIGCAGKDKKMDENTTHKIVDDGYTVTWGIKNNLHGLWISEDGNALCAIQDNDIKESEDPVIRYMLYIPLKYAVEVNMTVHSNRMRDVNTDKTYLERNIENFDVKVYGIGGWKIKNEIDVLEILKEKNMNIMPTDYTMFTTRMYENKPCLVFGAEDIVPSNEDKNNNTKRMIYIDVETGELFEKEYEDIIDDLEDENRINLIYTSQFSKFMKQNMGRVLWSDFDTNSVRTLSFFEGCRQIHFTDIEDISENNTKLFNMFPKLKSLYDGIKNKNEDKVRERIAVDIVLTGNPSEEEIMSIILPEGREVSFDGVKINAENSVDGKEHDIHSFDEWREYCKPAKDPGKYASPVVK